MACGCNKNKVTNTPVSPNTPLVAQIVESNSDFIEVKYLGPNYTHYIGSLTGIIVKYGMRNYGIGKHGDIVKIHIDDYNKANHLYEKVEQKEIIDITNKLAIKTLEEADLPEVTITEFENNNDDELLDNVEQHDLILIAEPILESVEESSTIVKEAKPPKEKTFLETVSAKNKRRK